MPDSAGILGGEAAGDFNGDGVSDVAVVVASGLPVFGPGESVSILLGNRSDGLHMAPGSPIEVYSGGIFLAGGPIAVGDFNGDGKLDLAVVDEMQHSVSILLGSGTGEFHRDGAPIPFTSEGSQPSIAVGDFEGNGKEALAIVAGANLNILRGDGMGGFTTAPGSPLVLPGYATSIVAGDFNRDGRSDLAVAIGSEVNEVAVYLSNVSQLRPAPGSPFATGEDPSAIADGDLTGNRRLDLVTANASSGSATVLLGDGAGGFTQAAGSPFPVPDGAGVPANNPGEPRSVAIGDFSCDGKPDIAVANWNGASDNVAVLQRDSSGSFTNAPGSPFPANGNPEALTVGDFNGDGSPDLAVVNSFLGRITVLEDTACCGSCPGPLPGGSGGSSGGGGSSQSVSGASEPPPGPPQIESLAAGPRARGGLVLRVALSRPGRLVVTLRKVVYRYPHGRRVEMLRSVGGATLAAGAGSNSLVIRRVKGRALGVGTYVLSTFAEVGTERSAVRTITVRIARRWTG